MGKTATNVSTVIVLIFLITTIILNGATYDWDGDEMDNFPLRSGNNEDRDEMDCRYIPNPCINFDKQEKMSTKMEEMAKTDPKYSLLLDGLGRPLKAKVDKCTTITNPLIEADANFRVGEWAHTHEWVLSAVEHFTEDDVKAATLLATGT